MHDIYKFRIANTKYGKKVVVELEDKQFFLPDRMNRSIVDEDMDKLLSIPTDGMKLKYCGIDNGYNIVDIYYDQQSHTN